MQKVYFVSVFDVLHFQDGYILVTLFYTSENDLGCSFSILCLCSVFPYECVNISMFVLQIFNFTFYIGLNSFSISQAILPSVLVTSPKNTVSGI